MGDDFRAGRDFQEYIKYTSKLPESVRKSVPRWPEDWKGKKIDNHILLADIIVPAEELGHPPDSREMDKHGPSKTQTYQKRFGSYPTAMKLAGFEPEFVSSRQKARFISEKEKLDEFLPDEE